jgi:hypothetical protein
MLDMGVPALPILEYFDCSLVSHMIVNGKCRAVQVLEMAIKGIKFDKFACRRPFLSGADFTLHEFRTHSLKAQWLITCVRTTLVHQRGCCIALIRAVYIHQ